MKLRQLTKSTYSDNQWHDVSRGVFVGNGKDFGGIIDLIFEPQGIPTHIVSADGETISKIGAKANILKRIENWGPVDFYCVDTATDTMIYGYRLELIEANTMTKLN